MIARSTSLLGAAGLMLLTGCSTAAPRSATLPVTRTVSAGAPTTSSAALIAQLKPQIQSAANAALSGHGTIAEGVGVFTNMGMSCPKTGSVQDTVVATVEVTDESGNAPNPAPAVRAYLEGRGWHFGPWKANLGPAPSRGGNQVATASKDGVTMIIDYNVFMLQVGATLPCLPGRFIPMGYRRDSGGALEAGSAALTLRPASSSRSNTAPPGELRQGPAQV